MIIAYNAWPPENGTYMWASKRLYGTPPPEVICPVCGVRTDWSAINPNYRPPRSYYDLSCSYDGDFLVSPRLRDLLESRNLSGLRFVPIPASRRYFILQSTKVVTLVRPVTARMEEYCAMCKQFKSVYGFFEEQLEGIKEPIREGIFFSDLRVGYFPNMGPELIFGVDTWQAMLAAKLKGLGDGKPILS